MLVPRVSKLFLKLPKEILVNKKCSFSCQTAGWSLNTSTNRDSVTCFLSKLRSPSGEQQFLGNSHLISKVHPIVGRFSQPPHCSAQLVPEPGDGRWCGSQQWPMGDVPSLLGHLEEVIAVFTPCRTQATYFKEHAIFCLSHRLRTMASLLPDREPHSLIFSYDRLTPKNHRMRQSFPCLSFISHQQKK